MALLGREDTSMKYYTITVDGIAYNVTVEEVEGRGKVAVFNGTNGWLEIPYGETFNPVENFEVSFDINTCRPYHRKDRTSDTTGDAGAGA